MPDVQENTPIFDDISFEDTPQEPCHETSLIDMDDAQRWEQVSLYSVDDLAKRLDEQGNLNTPAGQRLVLTWLAKHLGKKPRFSKRKHGHTSILYPLLNPKRFHALDEHAIRALVILSASTPSNKPTLSEAAALSTLALWIWSDPWASEAEQRLRTIALPDDEVWLMRVIKRIETGDGQRTPTLVLAQLALDSTFWNVAALIGALHLTHRYAQWKAGPLLPHIIKACDRVAQQHPKTERHWLELMADATIGGKLDHPWMERIMSACIRLNIDNPARQKTLRHLDRHKPYEASPSRLKKLYRPHLDQFRQQHREKIDERRLTPGLSVETEALQLKHGHAARAQTLLELQLIAYCAARRPGAHHTKLSHAFQRIDRDAFEALNLHNLVAFYVKNIVIDPNQAAFVRQWQADIDWQQHDIAQQHDLDLYLIISDYDRAFKHLTCKYDGMRLHHADKHAAEKVKYFIEKRAKIHQDTGLKSLTRAPMEFMGNTLASNKLLQTVTGQAVRVFEQRLRNQHLKAHVLETLQRNGSNIETYEDISQISLDHIQHTLRQQGTRRILLGALAGGLSGGLAPFSWSVVSMSDIPVLLALAADICGRFCWYYGFDPNEHPALPMTILAVALGGARHDALEPMLVRHNLQEFILKKSLVVNSLTSKTITHLAGRTLQQALEHYLGPRIAQTTQSLAKRAVSRNLQQRAAQATPTKKVPVLGMVLSATINGALIYDLCEAAQAVLTDRFLERKYPDWISKFAQHKESDAFSMD